MASKYQQAEQSWEIEAINSTEKERAKWTPDHLKLAQYETQFIFLYDNLRRAQNSHWFISDKAKLECTAFTVDKFLSWDYTLLGPQAYPIPLEYDGRESIYGQNRLFNLSHLHVEPSIIAGELYSVNDSTLIEAIDKLRGNGVKFQRKRVELQIPYRRTKWLKDVSKAAPEFIPVSPTRATTGWFTHKQKAWMWVGVKEFWEPQFDGGYSFSPSKLVKPNSEWVEHYYLFNNNR